MNEAIALSKSPLNTTIVAPSLVSVITGQSLTALPFSITETYAFFCESKVLLSSLLPVLSHQFFMSFWNPESVALISKISPSFSLEISSKVLLIGPGHCNPHASITTVLLFISIFSSFEELKQFLEK